MKLFKTNNIQIIDECLDFFGITLPTSVIVSRTIIKMILMQTQLNKPVEIKEADCTTNQTGYN